jgi:hypothetical protein
VHGYFDDYDTHGPYPTVIMACFVALAVGAFRMQAALTGTESARRITKQIKRFHQQVPPSKNEPVQNHSFTDFPYLSLLT